MQGAIPVEVACAVRCVGCMCEGSGQKPWSAGEAGASYHLRTNRVGAPASPARFPLPELRGPWPPDANAHPPSTFYLLPSTFYLLPSNSYLSPFGHRPHGLLGEIAPPARFRIPRSPTSDLPPPTSRLPTADCLLPPPSPPEKVDRRPLYPHIKLSCSGALRHAAFVFIRNWW
jgi:hypothetical protein